VIPLGRDLWSMPRPRLPSHRRPARLHRTPAYRSSASCSRRRHDLRTRVPCSMITRPRDTCHRNIDRLWTGAGAGSWALVGDQGLPCPRTKCDQLRPRIMRCHHHPSTVTTPLPAAPAQRSQHPRQH
jgi:hypothetical protein